MKSHTRKGIIGIGLVIAVVAVLAVAAGGYAYWHTKNKAEVAVDMNNGAAGTIETGSATDDWTDTPGTDGKKMAFSAFIKQGGSYECTVNQSIDGMDSTGKVWLNNGMIRGDYSVKANGVDIRGSTIIRDGFAYTWSSAFPMGFKVAVSEDANGSIGAGASVSGKTYSWNANQIGDYDCDSWKADASKFTIPSNITFQAIAS